MAAATSPVDVCNLALDQLKQGQVTSITAPSTDTENVCARWYDTTRRALLRKHTWSFAKSRRSIPRNSVTPTFGWADAYDLPNDFLRFLFFGDDSVSNYINLTKLYEIEGRQILLDNDNGSSLDLGYIKDEVAVTKFDALFVDLFAVELALRMAFRFTLKNTVVTRIQEIAKELRTEARAINGQERPPRRFQTSKFSSARRDLLSNVAGKNTVFRR